MHNKRRTMLTLLLTILLSSICFVVLNQLTTANTMYDIQQIHFQDTYSQKDEQYIVYFWQDSCKYCEEVKKDVTNFVNNSDIPIYLVNMQDKENQPAWYDWESHHQQYDQVIGEEIGGKPVLNNNVDLSSFEEDDNIYWTIQTNPLNEIIAAHQTAYNNIKPRHANELEITGTPSMIKINNGMFEQYASGVDEVRALLAD